MVGIGWNRLEKAGLGLGRFRSTPWHSSLHELGFMYTWDFHCSPKGPKTLVKSWHNTLHYLSLTWKKKKVTLKTNKKIKVLPSWQFQKNKRRQNVVKKQNSNVCSPTTLESLPSNIICVLTTPRIKDCSYTAPSRRHQQDHDVAYHPNPHPHLFYNFNIAAFQYFINSALKHFNIFAFQNFRSLVF